MKAMASVKVVKSTCKCIDGVARVLEQSAIEVEKVDGNSHVGLRR